MSWIRIQDVVLRQARRHFAMAEEAQGGKSKGFERYICSTSIEHRTLYLQVLFHLRRVKEGSSGFWVLFCED